MTIKSPKVLDNKVNKVVDELRSELRKDSRLSVVSAYFTIYAYAELRKELEKIDRLRFVFTEPTFVKKDHELITEFYIHSNTEKIVSGNEFEIKLRNEMRQAAIAKECANWLERKAEIRSLKSPNPAQPRLIYVENPETGRCSLKKMAQINSTLSLKPKGAFWKKNCAPWNDLK